MHGTMNRSCASASAISSCCSAEKIVLCIDACEDSQLQKYPIMEGGRQYSTFGLIKKCAEVFLLNKSGLNFKNEFAIITFKATTQHITQFSSNVRQLVKILNNIVPEPSPDHPTDLSRIFSTALEAIENDDGEGGKYRLIILYGRQGTCVKDVAMPLLMNGLTVDLLFLHKPFLSAKEKKRTEINFNELQSCLGEHSISAVALSSTYNAFRHMADALTPPNLRI